MRSRFQVMQTMTAPPNPSPDSPSPDSWERVASTLRACKEAQKQTWGDLDSSTLGRYLAGEVADDELGVIERELADHPELRQLTDIIRDVLGDLAAVAEPSPGPTVLSFEKARKRRRVLPFLRRHASLVAAACLLVVLGSVVPAGGLSPSRNAVLVASSDEVRFLENGVALSSSPTIPFNALGLSAPTEFPAPSLAPPSVELKVFPGGIGAKDAAHANLVYAKSMMTSRGAAAHLRRGRDEARDGRVVDAERSLSKSYAHCQEHLGAKHPITTQTAQELANLYAFALNDVSVRQMSIPAAPNAVMKGGVGLSFDKRKGEAATLGEQIAGQTLPQIQATVVPALVRALETAPTPSERQSMVSALGNLGPAAGPALPALRLSLDNASPAERQSILSTMARIGPASVPILDQLANTTTDNAGKNDLRNAPNHRANLSDDDRTLIRGTLRELRCPESHAGIADEAACLSFREIRAASMRLHRLAKGKQSGILVLIQTKAACRPGDCVCPERLGKRGVYVVLDLAGRVEVEVSPALAKAGFSAAAVRDAMLAPCKAKQFDKACDAGIDLIVAQAAKLKPARP